MHGPQFDRPVTPGVSAGYRSYRLLDAIDRGDECVRFLSAERMKSAQNQTDAKSCQKTHIPLPKARLLALVDRSCAAIIQHRLRACKDRRAMLCKESFRRLDCHLI